MQVHGCHGTTCACVLKSTPSCRMYAPDAIGRAGQGSVGMQACRTCAPSSLRVNSLAVQELCDRARQPQPARQRSRGTRRLLASVRFRAGARSVTRLPTATQTTNSTLRRVALGCAATNAIHDCRADPSLWRRGVVHQRTLDFGCSRCRPRDPRVLRSP
jgi:hypothetical protein